MTMQTFSQQKVQLQPGEKVERSDIDVAEAKNAGATVRQNLTEVTQTHVDKSDLSEIDITIRNRVLNG